MHLKSYNLCNSNSRNVERSMLKLSQNQRRIGRLVALGYSNREVAAELGVTETAVKSALHVMFDKLGVWNRVEFAARMLQNESPAVQEESRQRIEAERLAELYRCQVLDSVAEQMFEEITGHLVSFFEVPIALVGLIDSNRLWFKSSRGMDVSQLPRELTVCHHTIQQSQINEVPDADRSAFACNPLMSQFGLKFYAASPILTSDGYALGVVCIVDQKPRQFDHKQLSLLTSYARLASRQFELRRDLIELKQPAAPQSPADQTADTAAVRISLHVLGETA